MAASLVFLTTLPLAGQSAQSLPEMVVLAERRGGDGAPLAEWGRADLREAAPRTIDEMLAQEPAFSLYRRQSAMFGNPTSAGVSLRNTGATAASRTLVLLDGVPQNDPFGGWVYWARYDAAALDAIRIVPSARAAVWGNQSPAGVIQMNSRAPFEQRHVVKAGAGGQGTVAGSMLHQVTDAEGGKSVMFSAFGLHSDGFYAVGPSQRGSIDRKLDIDLWGADVKFAWLAAPGLTVEPGVSFYTEERGNGTPLAGNSTDALDFSLRVTAENAGVSWQALAWHQRREFESVFSSVNADRSAETLAQNQFDVPGRGTGAAVTLQWERGDQWSFIAGIDTRLVSGETNEDVGTFRRREAGGDQDFLGIFGVAEYRPDEATTLSGSARLDAWWLRDGRRIETSLGNGATLRNERQDDRDGIEPSASLELTRRLHEDLEARVSAGSGFRLPTLNELHRPFRVRNDIVEANPQLDPERFVSIEAGVEWKPTENLTIGTALFHHWISDAVANVPVTDPLEIAEIFGTIPPGGSGSIRRNVDAAWVAGIEGAIAWLPHEQVTLGLSGLWSDTRFSESKQQPLLEGILTDKQIRSMVIFLREKEKQTMVEGMEFPVPSPDTVTNTELHDYRIETLVESGIERPWAIAFLPDDRKLVTERPGRLRFLDKDGKLDPQLVEGTPEVIEHGQGGLMEVALHPDYEKNGWIYLGFAEGVRKPKISVITAVVRGRIEGHRWIDQEWIYRPDDKFRSGSGVHFGTRFVCDKGYIYFVIGERGGMMESQDLSRPNGKIFRLHDDGRVPEDNPFVSNPEALPGIWSYGHRNPQGLVMDPRDGALYSTEHGPRGGDELNLILPGRNYGWPVITHGMNYNGTPMDAITEKEGMEQPLVHWTPSIAACGLDVVTGGRFPKWKHDLLAGGLAQQEVRRIRIVDGKVVHQEIILKNIGRVRDVAVGPDGLIYVLLNDPDRIVRLLPEGE